MLMLSAACLLQAAMNLYRLSAYLIASVEETGYAQARAEKLKSRF